MSKRDSVVLKRRKIIVFSFEGKANKTESLYFDHFCASDNNYLLKQFSSGANDPEKIVQQTKRKRLDYDYNAKEDLTFIFMDGDCDKEKIHKIEELCKKLGKDTTIVLSNPCFEVWYLNHFEQYGRIMNSTEIIDLLKKHLPNYSKNTDVYAKLITLRQDGIKNSEFQKSISTEHCSTDVVDLFQNAVIKDLE